MDGEKAIREMEAYRQRFLDVEPETETQRLLNETAAGIVSRCIEIVKEA